jgi:hypothetical protein
MKEKTTGTGREFFSLKALNFFDIGYWVLWTIYGRCSAIMYYVKYGDSGYSSDSAISALLATSQAKEEPEAEGLVYCMMHRL